ncbi:CPBP family intramembrane glutamic endopeptidase [Alistipes finegoldii]|nr:CPBP family intramembrane glutamic endopeptidase [Alistipes finegoldii]
MFTFIVVAGFFEELIFRGFVFGELFRTARWGFLPAATLTALAFGSLHLYQGDDLISASAAFGVTTAGSIFFSWIYVESENNLWSVIWPHTLMNAPWMLFSGSGSGAVGGLWANSLRLCTLLIAIALVVIYKKRKGLPYHISGKTLIINRQYV